MTKNLHEPILLEESTLEKVPATLEILIHENTKAASNSSQELRLHILALLTYYVSLEVGFVLENFSSSTNSNVVEWGFDKKRLNNCVSQQLPDSFIHQSHFRLNLNLINDDTSCVLLLMRSGDSLFTTITSKKFKGQSLYLSAARYVPYVNKRKISESFRCLNDFSIEIKNKLCGPIRDAILADHDQVFPGLTGLPETHLDSIFKYLSTKDLKHVAWTCWYLYKEVKNYKKRRNKK